MDSERKQSASKRQVHQAELVEKAKDMPGVAEAIEVHRRLSRVVASGGVEQRVRRYATGANS